MFLRVEGELLGVFVGVLSVGVVEVLGEDHVAVLTHGLKARLLADGAQVGRANAVGAVYVVLDVHLLRQIHVRRARLEDHALLAAVRVGELDFAVEAAGAQEGRVQSVRAVRRHDHLDVDGLVEPVHLVEELEQDALHLTVRTRLRVEALGRDRVHLVDEDDGGRVFFGQAENVADHAGAFAEILLHEFGADDGDERRGGRVGHGLGHHGFPRPRRPVHEHTPRRVDADLAVELELGERELDGLAHLLLLDVVAADVCIRHVRLGRHELDGGVGLGGQDGHHRVRVAVEGHRRVRLQVFPVQSTQDPHVVVRARSGLDDPVILIHHF
mmetsp:Transcript_67322/g.152328  ORF Transcript_67322/g.152328 Transcript_67322/m.152328 type:complete len:327 (+) Transcript_67322:217-1197(+)